MEYEFPLITHLDQVRSVIDGRREFIVADKGAYIVVNYVMCTRETFPAVLPGDASNAILRECRGLVFYPSGELMSRPYHKFFNVGEKIETASESINMNTAHMVLEKLDGSMIRPLYIEDKVRWATKMGTTDVAALAETFASTRPEYDRLALHCRESGLTPIFELCSRSNRIVVDYPVTRMVLTAARHLHRGTYLTYAELSDLGAEYGVPVVQARAAGCSDMTDFMLNVRGEDSGEGYVVRFEEAGHMVKVKTEWYVFRHKSKDAITSEKDTLLLVLSEGADDVKPLLSDGDRARLEDFETCALKGLRATHDLLYKYYVECRDMDRKDVAQKVVPKLQKRFAPLLFDLLKNEHASSEDCWKALIAFVKDSLGSKTKRDEIRYMWGGGRWAEDTAVAADDE